MIISDREIEGVEGGGWLSAAKLKLVLLQAFFQSILNRLELIGNAQEGSIAPQLAINGCDASSHFPKRICDGVHIVLVGGLCHTIFLLGCVESFFID